MRAGRPALALVPVLVALLPAAAGARVECADDQTLQQCWSANQPPDEVNSSRAGVQQLADALGKKVAGTNAIDSRLQTLIKDFISAASAAIETDAVDVADAGLSIDLNNILPIPTQQNYKLQAILRSPSVYQPLQNAIPIAQRAAVVSQLERDLTLIDDAALVFEWSPVAMSLGRSQLRFDTLYGHLFAAALREAEDGADREQALAGLLRAEDLLDLAMEHPDSFAEDGERTKFGAIEDEAVRARARALVAAAADRARQYDEVVAQRVRASGLFGFSDLIHNQRQLVFSAIGRLRDRRVGPDEATARLTYEHGFRNATTFVSYAKSRCHQSEPMAAELAAEARQALFRCFQQYRQENEKHLAAGDRIAFAADYTYVGGWSYNVPSLVLPLSLGSKSQLGLSLGYGRQFAVFGDESSGNTRVDLTARYENFFGDPARNNRALVQLSLTRRLVAGFSLALGVGYASDPELKGAARKEITASFGIDYKFYRDPG